MAYEHRDMSGSLFKNTKKTKPGQPDYTGMCKVRGEDLQISAWINEAQSSGLKFQGLKFSEPRQPQEQQEPPGQPPQEDDIPF